MLCKPVSKLLEFPFEPLHFALHRSGSYVFDKLLPLSTGTRSTHTDKKTNLPAIPHHRREQWNTWVTLLNDIFDTKTDLQLYNFNYMHGK